MTYSSSHRENMECRVSAVVERSPVRQVVARSNPGWSDGFERSRILLQIFALVDNSVCTLL
jgi:hypothetical protein